VNAGETGEFGIIGLLADLIGREMPAVKDLVLPIGDDAAAYRCRGALQLLTTDTLVQNVHFNLNHTGWRELGHKSLAVNLSDIAAMGGIPQYAVVALSLPPQTEVEDILDLYRGMLSLCREHDVHIAGGNVTAAAEVVITVTLTGYLNDKTPLARSAARPGDRIAITGFTGLAAAGLAMFNDNLKIEGESAALFRRALLQPQPRVKEGQALLRRGVMAAIDISDGLLADLQHVCGASHVGARIRAQDLPLHPFLLKHFPEKALQYALAGGEDYELLFCADAKKVAALKGELQHPVSVIGEIGLFPPGSVEVLDEEGRDLMPAFRGWEHFKSGG
jgi:thiamine-monophosphate kinase